MGSILVTGAAGALGGTLVERCLAAGDRVHAVDIDTASLEPLAASAAGLSLHACDLTDAPAVADLIAGIGSEGPLRVAHLAGGFSFSPVAETSDHEFERLIRLNLLTTFLVARSSARRFLAEGGGALVAVSSPHALRSPAGVGVYAASKAGVLRLVEALAAELAEANGRINAVLPGTMDTPDNRSAMPDEDPAGWVSTAHVAAVIAFLLGDDAVGINGAAVRVERPQG